MTAHLPSFSTVYRGSVLSQAFDAPIGLSCTACAHAQSHMAGNQQLYALKITTVDKPSQAVSVPAAWRDALIHVRSERSGCV